MKAKRVYFPLGSRIRSICRGKKPAWWMRALMDEKEKAWKCSRKNSLRIWASFERRAFSASGSSI